MLRDPNVDFEAMVKPNYNLQLVSRKSLEKNSLGYFFNKLMKLLGLVLKFRPMLIGTRMADLGTRKMLKGVCKENCHFMVVYCPLPLNVDLSSYFIIPEVTVIDDDLLFSMIEVLAENLKDVLRFKVFPTKVPGSYKNDGLNAPCCLQIVKESCKKLEDLKYFSNLSPKWKNFIFQE